MHQGIVLEQSQHLQMTPELYTGIAIMAMPAFELIGFIQNAVFDNPFLKPIENIRDYTETPSRDGESTRFNRATFDPDALEGRDSFYNTADNAECMEQSILRQISLELREPKDLEIAERLVYGLDECGYLHLDTDILADQMGVFPDRVEWVLKKMQTCCVPAGMAARSLQECLVAQLEAKDVADPVARVIAESHLEDLAKGRLHQIADALGVRPAEVERASEIIRGLNPCPIEAFDIVDIPAIPELTVAKSDGEWAVFPNDEVLPELVLDGEMVQTARESGLKGDASKRIRECIHQAERLVSAVELRKASMLSIAASIVSRQQDFFDAGAAGLHPMTMAEIADASDLSESTVSRICNGVYVNSPQGVVPLRYFFTSAVRGSTCAEVSSAAVKQAIKELVGDEDKAAPLSDARLVELLYDRGMDVSRRTVNKYRTALGILPRSKRKSK